MTSRTQWARGAWTIGVLAGVAACGGSDEAERAAQAAERAADAAELAAAAAQSAASAVQELALAAQSSSVTPGVSLGQGGGSGSAPVASGSGGSGTRPLPPVVPVVQQSPGPSGTVCVAPPGVSTTPGTIPEALGLLNSLPKPTTLECFLQTLSRPLALYMTSSTQSLQPATGGDRSPRTFVLRGSLEMSIVLDGPAMSTLELAYRTVPERSIKTEILFPVARDVTPERFFDRVIVGSESTECGNCHVAEAKEEFDGFPDGVFISDVIPPYEIFEVSLDRLRTERASCNADSEPGRCALLAALLDHGDVQPGELGNPGL